MERSSDNGYKAIPSFPQLIPVDEDVGYEIVLIGSASTISEVSPFINIKTP